MATAMAGPRLHQRDPLPAPWPVNARPPESNP